MAHITIGTTATRISYTATASQTAFTIPFEFFDEDEINVYQQGTLKTLTTHYTVSPVTTYTGGFKGGTVTLETGATVGDKIVLELDISPQRSTDFPTSGAFNITTLNTWIDKVMVIFKQAFENIDRKIGREATSVETYSLNWPDGATSTQQTVVVDSTNGITLSSSTLTQWTGTDGTVSAPYYSYASDTNTGFYRIGSDNVGLSLGGAKKVDFGAATTAFTGQVTGTGFTGTLDGSLGSGTPAAAVVTQLTSGGNIVSDTDSTDDLGTTSVRWRKLWVDDVQATTTISADGLVSGGSIALASGATITAFLDDDSMSANSATAGATQQSIKAYVDTLVSTNGGNWKASVLVGTTANITLSGVQTIDGVSAVVGSRVLVKDQSTASQNGIYVAASSTWARAADADAFSELVSAAVFVEKGSTLADTSFICTNDSGGSLGSTAVVWTQFGVGGGGGGWLGEGTDSPEGNSGDIIRINQQTLNNSVTMVATDNGSATGPLTIADSVVVTISSGATFKVL